MLGGGDACVALLSRGKPVPGRRKRPHAAQHPSRPYARGQVSKNTYLCKVVSLEALPEAWRDYFLQRLTSLTGSAKKEKYCHA